MEGRIRRITNSNSPPPPPPQKKTEKGKKSSYPLAIAMLMKIAPSWDRLEPKTMKKNKRKKFTQKTEEYEERRISRSSWVSCMRSSCSKIRVHHPSQFVGSFFWIPLIIWLIFQNCNM